MVLKTFLILGHAINLNFLCQGFKKIERVRGAVVTLDKLGSLL